MWKSEVHENKVKEKGNYFLAHILLTKKIEIKWEISYS